MTLILNQEQLDDALVLYELAYPVRVRLLDGGPQGMAGRYHGIGRYGPTTDERLDTPAHHITVSANLSAQMGTVCLLHELMHAHQNERFLPVDFDIQNDAHYRQANAGLREAFRAEMKDVRRKAGTSSKQLTAAYANVSFEVEARKTDALKSDFTLFTENGPVKIADPFDDDMTDEKGRYTYRIDIWRSSTWNSTTRSMGKKKFRGTYYVVAYDEASAKTFARKEWGESSDILEAYLRPPLPKGVTA